MSKPKHHLRGENKRRQYGWKPNNETRRTKSYAEYLLAERKSLKKKTTNWYQRGDWHSLNLKDSTFTHVCKLSNYAKRAYNGCSKYTF